MTHTKGEHYQRESEKEQSHAVRIERLTHRENVRPHTGSGSKRFFCYKRIQELGMAGVDRSTCIVLFKGSNKGLDFRVSQRRRFRV